MDWHSSADPAHLHDARSGRNLQAITANEIAGKNSESASALLPEILD
jgi:hypothetical protein